MEVLFSAVFALNDISYFVRESSHVHVAFRLRQFISAHTVEKPSSKDGSKEFSVMYCLMNILDAGTNQRTEMNFLCTNFTNLTKTTRQSTHYNTLMLNMCTHLTHFVIYSLCTMCIRFASVDENKCIFMQHY